MTRVTSKLLILLLFSFVITACNRAPESKEAVREGIIDHLGKNTGLDLKAMDIDVTNVSFQGSRATATVGFRPKNSPDAGMSMNYTLERQGKKWIVQKTAGSGHGTAADPAPPPSGALPPGHPPVAPQPDPPKK
jgi:hypothetical protein